MKNGCLDGGDSHRHTYVWCIRGGDMPFYKKFFYCLDSECGEFKSACQDCKYWNKSEGYYLGHL
jgi:hypothetical protein